MKYDVIVIGAGAGGLVVAIGCAKAGKKTLMIERGNYGGDCTNFGCVPSKSLITSADTAHHIKSASDVGIELTGAKEQSDPVLKRVRKIVSFIRSHEDAEALKKHGIDTITAKASFKDPHTLVATDADGKQQEVHGKKIIIATGSHPFVPSIDGLNETPYLTNETVFDLKSVPNRLIILGGGPIGCELAQAFQRIGSQVILIHKHSQLLAREPEEASTILMEAMKKDGVAFEMNAETKKVGFSNQEFTLHIEQEGKTKEIKGDQLLISVGRRPNVEGLELEAAKVKCSDNGIWIDNYARTSSSNIFAVGDIVGPPYFTHRAENHGRAVLTSLLLPGPFMKRLDKRQPIPRATFTDPEIASIGLLEKDAIEQFGDYGVATYKIPFSEVDRAICQGRTEGMIIIVTKKWSSQILGATIIGPRSGEMLLEISVAIHAKFPLKKLAQIIHPYPTYNQGIRKAADLWLTKTILPSILKFFGRNGKRKEKSKISWTRFIPLLVIIVLMVIAWFTPLRDLVTFDNLKANRNVLLSYVQKHFFLTSLIYIVLYIVMVALSIPGAALLSLIGGFLFMQPLSTIYVAVGATTGASIIFLAARTAFGEFLKKKAGALLHKMEEGFRENAISYMFFLRLVPLFPFWLVNLAPAFFGVGLFTFVWTTFLGIIPGSFVFTQAGSGLGAILDTEGEFSIGAIFNWQIRIALIALGILALIPIVVKKIRKKIARKEMIDSYFRESYQKVFVDPVLQSPFIKKLSPQSLTLTGCFIGVMTGVFLWLGMPWIALVCLLISGYFDTLDGSVARIQNLTSDTGAVLDIVSDRLVEWSVILGLFLIDPIHRGLLCILMLGSILLCITSFLVVGVFSKNDSEKSFHYSPGLIERSEAFFFFGLMILLPHRFELFSIAFSLLVFFTSFLRIVQFLKHSRKPL